MVKFNDLKNGHPFYFLSKGKGLKYYQGTVVNISQPYFPTTALGATPNYSNRVIDITVQSSENTKTYTVNENASISETPDGIVITSDREGIAREVEAIRIKAEEELSKVDQNKLYLKDSEEILEQLNPALAEKKETDRRIKKLEDNFDDMKGLLQDISSTLKNLKR